MNSRRLMSDMGLLPACGIPATIPANERRALAAGRPPVRYSGVGLPRVALDGQNASTRLLRTFRGHSGGTVNWPFANLLISRLVLLADPFGGLNSISDQYP